jgi:hypothetical protein
MAPRIPEVPPLDVSMEEWHIYKTVKEKIARDKRNQKLPVKPFNYRKWSD